MGDGRDVRGEVAVGSGATSWSPRAIVAAGVSGALAPVVFVTTVLVAGAITPGYSPIEGAISELFAAGAPTSALVTLGMLGFGLLAMPLVFALLQVPEGGMRWTALALTVDAVGAGSLVLFPCSNGCPGPSASTGDLLHLLVAGVAYVGHLAAPLLATYELQPEGAYAWLRRLAFVLGIPALIVFGVWATGVTGAYGGLAQRVFTMLVDVWIVALALVVVRTGLRQRRT